MRYDDYIAAFNAGDDAALARDFFTPDCIFQTGTRRMVGHGQLLEFLRWAHDGVREIIRAKLVLEREDAIFAEIDMDFHASRDRPDFPFKPLQAGETTTVKFFAVYRLRDGKVAELRTANWPAEVGVTRREPMPKAPQS
jgi:hypothetical protein